jgi:hypothetical protein
MIGTVSSWVSKVVGTVKSPFYGKSVVAKKTKKVSKKVKCAHKGKCKCN